MNLKKFKKLSVWACSGLLVSLFLGLTPLNDNLCNLKTSTVVYAEGRVFNYECINRTTYNKETKTLTIPDGFTEIGTQDLFSWCPDLETVNIPASVEIIGNSAFLGCKNLTKVNIASGSKLKEIGNGAFEDCTALKVITLPEGLQKIGRSAFKDCRSLVEINIPDNVESIGRHAFGYCTSLKNISLPQKIKKIEYCTFGCCSSLENINIPNNVQIIDSEAFKGCDSLVEICLPGSVRVVADDAFKNCSSLKQINIPNATEIFDGFSLSLRSELRIVDDLKVSSNIEVCRYACENRDNGRTDEQIPLIADPSFPPSPQLPRIGGNHETMEDRPEFPWHGLLEDDYPIEDLGSFTDLVNCAFGIPRQVRRPVDHHREHQQLQGNRENHETMDDMPEFHMREDQDPFFADLAGRHDLPRDPNPQNMREHQDPFPRIVGSYETMDDIPEVLRPGLSRNGRPIGCTLVDMMNGTSGFFQEYRVMDDHYREHQDLYIDNLLYQPDPQNMREHRAPFSAVLAGSPSLPQPDPQNPDVPYAPISNNQRGELPMCSTARLFPGCEIQ